jgi:hypothetical protein
MAYAKQINVALWIVQGGLAALFLFAGGMKLVMPIELMTEQLPLPGAFLRFIGTVEVLGALGLVLPSLLRIRPRLTPLAALGLVLIMQGAIGCTVAIMDFSQAAVPFAVGVLAAIVAYGRWQLVPLAQRAPRLTLRVSNLGVAVTR